MNLLNLAPNIQEEVLFFPAPMSGRDPILLRELQPVALQLHWPAQRQLWRRLLRAKKID